MTLNWSSRRVALAFIGISMYSLIGMPSHGGNIDSGEKGAQIYCFMRESGNSHDVSWRAAYEVIKRQGNNFFKTSPKHGAVLITEAVVQNSNEFNSCGLYLGDLFRNSINMENAIESENENEGKSRYSF